MWQETWSGRFWRSSIAEKSRRCFRCEGPCSGSDVEWLSHFGTPNCYPLLPAIVTSSFVRQTSWPPNGPTTFGCLHPSPVTVTTWRAAGVIPPLDRAWDWMAVLIAPSGWKNAAAHRLCRLGYLHRPTPMQLLFGLLYLLERCLTCSGLGRSGIMCIEAIRNTTGTIVTFGTSKRICFLFQ